MSAVREVVRHWQHDCKFQLPSDSRAIRGVVRAVDARYLLATSSIRPSWMQFDWRWQQLASARELAVVVAADSFVEHLVAFER